MTAQDQQSRAPYEDGKWYWVEHEGWHGEPPTIAPACYKAECDAWYSYIFSGISSPYLKVLGPCELQAARALPAGMEPVAWLHINRLGAAQAFTTEPPPGFKAQCAPLYTAAQVQAMLAAEKLDTEIPVELIVHEPVLQPLRSLRLPECWCECCDIGANSGWRSRMSLCPKCGDKRCPRAYHHNSDCSVP